MSPSDEVIERAGVPSKFETLIASFVSFMSTILICFEVNYIKGKKHKRIEA